jgi:predicted O-linked N-acetylglucosamine transferase (SPINDLY family)
MGAPVVALAGQTHVSRVCVSLLAGLGLTELLADSPEQYVKIALELAADPNRLERLRADLRERMRQAPLTDARRFTRSFEQACRRMWRRWCGSEEQ